MQKKQPKKGMSAGNMVAMGAGLAAVGAGAYMLLGPDGKKNQKKAKEMIRKIEKEIETKAKPFIKKEKKQIKKVISKTTKTVKKITAQKKTKR